RPRAGSPSGFWSLPIAPCSGCPRPEDTADPRPSRMRQLCASRYPGRWMKPNARGEKEGSIGSETSEGLAGRGPRKPPGIVGEPPETAEHPLELPGELEEAEREIERQRVEIEEMRDRILRLEEELDRTRRPRSEMNAETKPNETVKAAPRPV